MKFPCSPGGAVETGRRRLRAALLLLAVVCFAVAVAAGFARTVPALLAVAAGAMALYARRMSADLDPIWLEVGDGALVIQMRRQRHRIDLGEMRVRELDADEIEHITRLATTGPITAGTGGFDSHRLGEIDLYATDLGNCVLLQAEESGTVVTPDDPPAFIDAVKSSIPVRSVSGDPSDSAV